MNLQWVFKLLQMGGIRVNKPVMADGEWTFELVLVAHI